MIFRALCILSKLWITMLSICGDSNEANMKVDRTPFRLKAKFQLHQFRYQKHQPHQCQANKHHTETLTRDKILFVRWPSAICTIEVHIFTKFLSLARWRAVLCPRVYRIVYDPGKHSWRLALEKKTKIIKKTIPNGVHVAFWARMSTMLTRYGWW